MYLITRQHTLIGIEDYSKGDNGDDVTWTLSGTFNELGNVNTLRDIRLNQPTACKYLKIVALNTYRNYPQ